MSHGYIQCHPEYGIRNWTKSQVEHFKKQGYVMNGYLGEEGTYGYLANNAGGVRRWATKIKQANPVIFFVKYLKNRQTKKQKKIR